MRVKNPICSFGSCISDDYTNNNRGGYRDEDGDRHREDHGYRVGNRNLDEN